MKRPKILVVGSFMMDLIASAPRVPDLGETVIGTSFRTAPGGKGANQALQCARLGAEVTMAGCVGDDAFGREMTSTLAAGGVDISHVKVSGKSPSGVGCIQLEERKDGVQNRILVVPGANYDLREEDIAWMKDGIGAYDLLMLQLEMDIHTTKAAARYAFEAGVPVMLNPAPAAPLDREFLSCVTYLSPNEHEASLLGGTLLTAGEDGIDQGQLLAAAERLRSMGVDKVIVTLGSNGAALCDGEGVRSTPCVRMPEVKDPTAAGDSFVAAFCVGITAGLTEQEALAFASHTAAITVSGMGAMPSLPYLGQVKELMKERQYCGFDVDGFCSVLEK